MVSAPAFSALLRLLGSPPDPSRQPRLPLLLTLSFTVAFLLFPPASRVLTSHAVSTQTTFHTSQTSTHPHLACPCFGAFPLSPFCPVSGCLASGFARLPCVHAPRRASFSPARVSSPRFSSLRSPSVRSSLSPAGCRGPPVASPSPIRFCLLPSCFAPPLSLLKSFPSRSGSTQPERRRNATNHTPTRRFLRSTSSRLSAPFHPGLCPFSTAALGVSPLHSSSDSSPSSFSVSFLASSSRASSPLSQCYSSPAPPSASAPSPLSCLRSVLDAGTVALQSPLSDAQLTAFSSLLAVDYGTHKMGMALLSLTDPLLASAHFPASSSPFCPGSVADELGENCSLRRDARRSGACPEGGKTEGSEGTGDEHGEREGESEHDAMRQHPHWVFVEAERDAARREMARKKKREKEEKWNEMKRAGPIGFLLRGLEDDEESREESAAPGEEHGGRSKTERDPSGIRDCAPVEANAKDEVASSQQLLPCLSPRSSSEALPFPSVSTSLYATSLLRLFAHEGSVDAAVARICAATASYGVRAVLVGHPRNPLLYPRLSALTLRSLLCRDFAVLLSRALLQQQSFLPPSAAPKASSQGPKATQRGRAEPSRRAKKGNQTDASPALPPAVFLYDESLTTAEARRAQKERSSRGDFLDSQSAAVLGRRFLDERGGGGALVLPTARTFFSPSFFSARRSLSDFQEFYRSHPAIVELAKNVPWELLL
ncbi:conserved hypothetical protein [Neospora caninum Liverpool]|uniref:Uncharacterized protein n=1 Tax=Neospora caninum (strain Liverpool) TaxID=572307 RepID=F0VEE0_NEOCL|nr:conserved hypothetical protein [Neospora caninum Liverpool]CBZ52084.1 conserved hypothetical protein [Neospora caninum Liverpool]CEL66046.1 TPA: hypothetical protein BN1204_018740 [Neospora caninum Liverpool]|eukprot:XP_003882116.1 conserved hypothetical protein [Neospora caninum Liverpool]